MGTLRATDVTTVGAGAARRRGTGTTRPSIVAGLGGDGGWHALAWAAEEAAATGGRLVLCHACRSDSALAGRGPLVPMGLLEVVDPALARAVATVRGRLGGDRVTLRIEPGRPEYLLVAAAAGADLVVIGSGRGGGPGGTAHRLVARAPCPVVCACPAGGGLSPPLPAAGLNPPLPAAGRGPFAGHVVVGVDGSDAGRAALEFAFRLADAHRRPLAAVHVTAGGGQDYWFDETMLATQFTAEPAGLALLATEVEPWMRAYPTVGVKRAVYAGRPVPGLLRAAAGASLLVVGDRGRGGTARALLGSVSDAVLDAARGPVAVVPGDRRPAHSRTGPRSRP